jgi:hypothetical protein
MVRVLATAIFLAAHATACVSWFKGTVATGIARLTVRNVGALTTLVSNDTTCGFASDAVLQSPAIDGDIGGIGTVTFNVADCTITLPERTLVSEDCSGAQTTASGSITVTAQKIVRGRLTGDTGTPVIPEDPKAATIRIAQATFAEFYVEKSTSDNAMTWHEGSISAVVQPKLAAAESGACAASTPNVTFSEVHYGPSLVRVRTPDRSFEADVDGSDLWAQNGQDGDYENHLEGMLNVWGVEEKVPTDDDEDGLDPDYERQAFLDSYACIESAKPIRYTCDIGAGLSHGMARLTVRTVGGILKALNADTRCGFASAPVLGRTATTGLVGYPGGQCVWTVNQCNIDLPEPTVLGVDCHGNETIASGLLSVSATKRVTGYVTGDPDSPCVPTSRDPVSFELDAFMQNWHVEASNSTKSLFVQSGRLSATVAPRLALDTTSGACSVATPNTRFEDVRWTQGDVQLRAGSMRLGGTIQTSALSAVNGHFEDRANFLAGSLTLDGEAFEIPQEDSALDPEYDPWRFDQGYACIENMRVPASESECTFTAALAQNMARLVIKNFGMVVKGVDLDTQCGFASLTGLIPSSIGPAERDSDLVTATWDLAKCGMGSLDAAGAFLAKDCLGDTVTLLGKSEVTATKTATGALALGNPPIQPQDRRSARFDMENIRLTEFAAVQTTAAAPATRAPYLLIHSGTLSGVGLPVTGEAADTPGAFFIKTPVMGMEAVRLRDAQVTLVAGAKRFHGVINDSLLNAFSGSFGVQENSLEGTLTLNGTRVTLPLSDAQRALDPAYDQDDFDSRYVCKENLLETVPPAVLPR